MPDDLQLKHECFCGNKVLQILGILHSDFRHGNPYDFEPDLIFKTGEHHIGIEVTSAYPEDDPRFGDQGHLKINATTRSSVNDAQFQPCASHPPSVGDESRSKRCLGYIHRNFVLTSYGEARR